MSDKVVSVGIIQFLRHRLEQEMPERVGELHRRAAQAQTSPDRVIAHYLAAEMWEEAALAIERVGGEMTYRVFTNTIVAGHAGVGITTTAGSAVTMTYMLWHGNGAHTGGGGAFDISRDVAGDPAPLFVNPSAWDYHLTNGSAAIDAGVDAGVTTDIDGDPRPLSSGYDLGADEYSVVAVQLAPDRSGVAAFGIVTYTHTLTNAGNYTDTFALTYHSTQGWAQVAPGGPITLGQGATQTMWVIVTVPTDAISGTVKQIPPGRQSPGGCCWPPGSTSRTGLFQA